MTDITAIDTRIAQVNHRLKAARLGLHLERRGNKLNLRGTLPPRPGSHRLRPHQQRISLDIPATSAGLKQAEQEAKVIAAQLIQHTFSWKDYLPISGGGRLHQMELPEKVMAFKQQFLAQPQRRADATRSTWATAYEPYMRRLEAIAQSCPHLSLAEAIYATVNATRPNSRSRQVCCTALGALADFLEVELPQDLKTLWGNYGASTAQMRCLPSDEDIVALYDSIPNPAWKFVYGIMATYGLRNHEVFFCDYSRLITAKPEAMIEVLETTKTGIHQVWPFPTHWVDRFNLHQVQLPKLNTDLSQTTLQRIGQLVSTQFRRYQLPFSPYDLRHAWAVRTINLGLPDSVAARMMGHSVDIHTRTYHRWMTLRDQQQAVDNVLRRAQQESDQR